MAASKGFQRRQAGRDAQAQQEQFFAQFFPQLLAALQANIAPALQGQRRVAANRGLQLGQDIQGALGALGGGASGVGQVRRSLASTLSANSAASAESGIQLQLLMQAFQGALGTAGTSTQLGQNVKINQGIGFRQVLGAAALGAAPFTGGLTAIGLGAAGGALTGGGSRANFNNTTG